MIPGQPPNPDRIRRNADPYETDRVVHDGVLRGPLLPKDRTWCKRTQEWWKVWRKSPQAKVMTETDWETMLECAILHDKLWSSTNLGPVNAVQLANQIKQRVACFGATYEDRKKLRMEIETPQTLVTAQESFDADAKQAVDYMSRLTEEAAKAQE